MNKRQRKKDNSLQYAFFGYEKLRGYTDFPLDDPVINRKRLCHLEYKRWKREQRKQGRARMMRHRRETR